MYGALVSKMEHNRKSDWLIDWLVRSRRNQLTGNLEFTVANFLLAALSDLWDLIVNVRLDPELPFDKQKGWQSSECSQDAPFLLHHHHQPQATSYPVLPSGARGQLLWKRLHTQCLGLRSSHLHIICRRQGLHLELHFNFLPCGKRQTLHWAQEPIATRRKKAAAATVHPLPGTQAAALERHHTLLPWEHPGNGILLIGTQAKIAL